MTITNFMLIFLTLFSRCLNSNSFINCATTLFTSNWHCFLTLSTICCQLLTAGIYRYTDKCLLTLFTAYVFWILTLSRPVLYWQFKTVNCSLTLFMANFKFFTRTFYDLLTTVYWHILRLTDSYLLAFTTCW